MKARLSPWAALLALCVAFGWFLLQQPPTGVLEGVVLMPDGRPLARVLIWATDANGAMHRNRTDRDGRFRYRHLPVGRYLITTAAEAHEGQAKARVVEAERATVALHLKRSIPILNVVGSRQAVWSRNETPRLPVGGFADTKTLRVSLWRTRPGDLLRGGDAFAALEQLDRTWEKAPTTLPAPLALRGAPIAQADLPVDAPDREGVHNTRLTLPVPPGKPGLYLVRIDGPRKSRVFSWILVTDIAVVAKRPEGDARVLVYAVDQNTGRPLPGARIERMRDGRPAGSATADAHGLAWLPPLPASAKERTDVFLATHGDDQAAMGDSLWAFEPESRRTVIHLHTDRTIYRPGHTIRYKGIVRRRPDPAEPTRYAIPAGEAVDVVLRDAGGAQAGRARATLGPDGAFDGAFETSPEAATGGFRLEATVAGATHGLYVPVAAYRKPEFEVTVTPAKARALSGETLTATIDARYHFGAPVAGAKVRWHAYADVDWEAEIADAALWDAVDEDDRASVAGGTYYGAFLAEGTGVLDASGRLVVAFPSRDPDQKGDARSQAQRVTLSASVTDPAEREGDGEASVRVTAAERTVAVQPEGYVAKPGQPVSVFVLARDLDGRPAPGTTVALQPFRLVTEKLPPDDPRREWGERTRQVRRPQGAPQQAVAGADGRAIFTVVPERAGELELEARATDASGRTARSAAQIWAASDHDTDLDAVYDDLTLLTDRRLYQPGQTARVLVNAARTGQTALLTVESDRIHAVFPVKIARRSTVVRVPILESYGPNVTLGACYVRDKRFADVSVPLRVTLPRRTLTVAVTPDRATAAPGERVGCTVRVRDAAGRPVSAAFSLAVVDEAIFALREDDPKDLRRDFYPLRGRNVFTRHSFQIGYLGGDDKGDVPVRPRSRFLDTAFWAPALRTGADGRARVEIPLPDNLTAWRITARAVTDADTQVGVGRGTVAVRKPFFLRLETPRFLSEGDTARVLALVHNETEREQRVRVRLSAAGLAGGAPETQAVTVAAGKVGTVEWPLAPTAPADLRLQAVAWTEDRAFTDGVVARLDVRPFGRQIVWSAAGTQDGPSRLVDIPVSPGSVAGERRLTVRINPGLAGPVAAALGYLTDYPYGCTEQTVSRLWPLARAHAVDPALLTPDQARTVGVRVRDGLARLRAFQQQGGGWGWWQTDQADPFLTAYVLTALVDLRAAGHAVPREMVDGAVRALTAMRKERAGRSPYGRLALARAGVPLSDPLPAPRGMRPADLAWTLLLARETGADPGPYRDALRRLERREGPLTRWAAGRGDADSSDRMETAAAVRALLALDPDDPSARAGIRWLLTERTGDSFGDTRDTAATLAALCDYLARHPQAAQAPTSVAVRVNGTPVTLEGDPRERVARVPSRLLRPGANTLEMRCDGGDPASVFWSASLRQILAGDPSSGLEPLTPDGIALGREYLRAGETRGATSFAPGELVEVRLAVTAPRGLEYVLVEDLFPAGFEPTDRGTADVDLSGAQWNEPYDNLDVRDDRVAFFFRRLRPGKHVFTYHLRAQTPGRYRVVPASLTPMYRPELRVESRDGRVEVGR